MPGSYMNPAKQAPPPPRHMLVRLRGEPTDAHRALLLYAMGGERCSLRIASKACKRNESSLRSWRKTWEWDDRILETADPDVEAFLVYQSEYAPQYGVGAVIRLCENIVEPFGFLKELDRRLLVQEAAENGYPEDEPDKERRRSPRKSRPTLHEPPAFVRAAASEASRVEPTLREVKHDAEPVRPSNPELTRRLVEALGIETPAAPPSAAVPPGGALPPAAATPKSSLERDIMLVDGALGYIAGKIRAGEVKARISDIPMLLKIKMLMRGEATARVELQASVAAGTASPPTVRLVHAGSDPALRRQAMREDLADLTAILDGIECSDQQAAVNDGRVVDTTAQPAAEPKEQTA